jgi:hypothetical protein
MWLIPFLPPNCLKRSGGLRQRKLNLPDSLLKFIRGPFNRQERIRKGNQVLLSILPNPQEGKGGLRKRPISLPKISTDKIYTTSLAGA